MSLIIDLFSWACLLGGSFFVVVGGIGLIRLPDFYTRIHGASVTDTMGAGLILLGLMLQAGFSLISAKLLLILIFMWLTGPAAGHALAHTARHAGLDMYTKKNREDT